MANKIIKFDSNLAVIVDSAGSLSVEVRDGQWFLRVYLVPDLEAYTARLPGIEIETHAQALLDRILVWMTEPDDGNILHLPAWCYAIANP